LKLSFGKKNKKDEDFDILQQGGATTKNYVIL